MKFTTIFVCAVLVILSITSVAGGRREVRSYTSDMEYVDHVDINQNSEDLPVAEQHSMMETESSEEPTEEKAMHFFMESEAESEDALDQSFIEAESQDDLDTEVMRAMALEIHDAAQENIDESGEVQMLIEVSADPSVLSAEELAEEKADFAADKADAIASQKDAAEEVEEAKEAQKDAAILATPLPTPAPAPVQTAVPPPTTVPAPAPAAPAPVVVAAPPKIVTVTKDVVQLPPDLSAEHAETLRANEAATGTIKGALKEMGAILQSKDDTIRSLVYNISYLTVGIGKLANKVDLQKSYIELLRSKLRLAKSKNRELRRHVAHTKKTTKSIRAQLQQVEARLNNQDAKTTQLKSFLKDKKDTIRLPQLADDLEVRGTPVNKKVSSQQPRRRRRRSRRVSSKLSHLRPVEGTQTYADAHSIPFIPAQATFIPASHYFVPGSVPTPLTHPTYNPYDGIPTIVVERSDDGK
jgi:hypothetical protein